MILFSIALGFLLVVCTSLIAFGFRTVQNSPFSKMWVAPTLPIFVLGVFWEVFVQVLHSPEDTNHNLTVAS